MKRPTVVLADDHRLVIEGVKRLIEDEYDVVATVDDGAKLLEVVREQQPDLVVTDISMPNMSGLTALKALRSENPEARVVVLTMHRDEAYAASALEEGARGFVLKHGEPEDLIRALQAALEDRVYVSPAIAGDVVMAVRSGRSTIAQLSDRQRRILGLVSKGRSLKQIAAELGVSVKTVEYHKYRMMAQLEVKTTAELVRLAVDHENDGI